MPVIKTRRQFLTGLSLVGVASLWCAVGAGRTG